MKRKFWTIQSKSVVDMIVKDEFYQPDFRKSQYLKMMPQLNSLYYNVLENAIRENIYPNDCKGLVFAFTSDDVNGDIVDIDSIDDFFNLIGEKQYVIESLWRQLTKGNDRFILELEYDFDKYSFNPFYIDINDFQILMPPLYFDHIITEEYYKQLKFYFYKGIYVMGPIRSGIVQAHLPYISKDNLIDIYPLG